MLFKTSHMNIERYSKNKENIIFHLYQKHLGNIILLHIISNYITFITHYIKTDIKVFVYFCEHIKFLLIFPFTKKSFYAKVQFFSKVNVNLSLFLYKRRNKQKFSKAAKTFFNFKR